MNPAESVGVLLMTYGSPETLDDVPEYMTSVRGGRPPEEGLVAEFTRRYRLIGGSPLTRITRDQAMALQVSTNLTLWTNIFTNADSSIFINFLDQTSPSRNPGYYRLKRWP